MRVQRYRLTPAQALNHCNKLLRSHAVDRKDLVLDESAPDDRVVLQAEVMNSPKFIDMRYALNARGLGMRQAYEIMKHAGGIKAVTILKECLDAESWDNLCEILENYGDSVVELSSYEIPVGVLGWNSLVWEVRNY